MLVLTRKQGDVILINDDIKIVINRIIGGQVVVGIEAPMSYRIVREEIKDKYMTDKAIA